VGYLVLKDFIAIGFTNSDDTSNYVSSLIGGVFTDARAWAEGQGRFYFYYRVPWARIPYLIDHVYWLKTLQYLPVISGLILFSVILGNYFRSFYFGVIVITFLFAFFSIPSAAYQPPTAYPFLFTTDVVLFLLSIFFYQRYQRTDRYAYFIAFLFFFSVPMFSYESYIVFYFGLLVYVAFRHVHLLKKKNFRQFLFNKEVLPILGIGIVFIIMYFGYRFIIGYPSSNTTYDGNTLATKIDLYNVLKLIHNFNSSAFPMHTYFKNRSVFSAFDPNFKNSLFYVLSHLSLQEILKPILLSSLVYFSLTKTPIHLLTLKRSLLIFFGSIIMCYAQNLLFGFTQKYNQDVYTLDGYVTTYHSFYGISLAIIVLLVYPATRIKQGVIKKIYFVGIGLLVFVISSLTAYSNKILSKDLQIVHHKFQLVDALIKDKEMIRLGKKSMIKMEQLNETPSLIGGSVCYGHFSWIGYLYGKSKKQFKLLSDDKTINELLTENSATSYCLLKQLIHKEKEVVTLIFSPLENQSLKTDQLISNKLLIYVYIPNNRWIDYSLKINGESHRLVRSERANGLLTSNVHRLQKVNSEIYKTYINVKNINIETVVTE
jgi:hypothetical protein